MSLITYELIKKQIDSLKGLIDSLKGSIGNSKEPTQPKITNFFQMERVETEIDVWAISHYTHGGESRLYGCNSNGIVELVDGVWEQVYISPSPQTYLPRATYRMENGNFLFWYYDRLVVLSSDFNVIKTHTGVYNPLNLTVGIDERDGVVMFSEYRGDSGTNGNKIWRTQDYGLTIEIALEISGISHFHSVQSDPYTGDWYACSGDGTWSNQINHSDDNGETWSMLVNDLASGGHNHRLVGIAFSETHLFWLPDNPNAGRNNHIFRIARENIKDDWLVHEEIVMENVEGASYGNVMTANGQTALWTSAENSPYSAIYMSDGDNGKEVARVQKVIGGTVLLSGFNTLTKVDKNNQAYLVIKHSHLVDGLYKVTFPI